MATSPALRRSSFSTATAMRRAASARLGSTFRRRAHPRLEIPRGALGALAGVTEPFDQGMLDKLYPAGRAEYLKKFDRSLESAIKSGFILHADEGDIKALAAAMFPASK
jgi:hypothetical protein